MCAFDPCQLALWDFDGSSGDRPAPGGLQPLPMPGADVRYDPDFLPYTEAQALFEELLAGQPWHQVRRRMYDRDLNVPRLQVWYGDPGGALDLPSDVVVPRPWPEILTGLRQRVEQAANERLNAVLLNLYRDGRDSVAWHSDYEALVGPRPMVASLTLGATRRFMFRPKKGRAGHPLAFDLPPGSLLLMGPGTQDHWEHQVPKTARPLGPRINLTFRIVPAPRER